MSFAGQLYETAGRLAKYAQISAAALEEERLQIEMRRACQVRQGITADERSSAVHAGLKLRNT
jgi:hypothetical protein